ncbi:MAG: M61 family metallopeptidase [Aureliella sp.]
MLHGAIAPRASVADDRPMRVEIDARDLPRKLLSATVHLPVENAGGKVVVWYPKWVPGSHAPGGPIANVAGLQFEDTSGQQLTWRRTPGEVYRFEVAAPAGTTEIVVRLRYITNQPTTNAVGLDSYGSRRLGMVSPNTVLLYVDGMDIDSQIVHTSIELPESWTAATALRATKADEPNKVVYQPASLRDVVDSPIMCGQYHNKVELAEPDSGAPPHTLHVFTDDEKTKLPDAILKRLRGMVTQTSRLIGSHPFDRFDVLLAVTDRLNPNGLEHARSTFNILPPSALVSAGAWKGWNRLLIPHEYLHAWCGKYRRPAGMLTGDFHTPKGTELLWVYEGLTQYLGELVEARSGIMSEAEFLHRFEIEVRRAIHQQGRKWRSLADTAAASHVLRASSPAWSSLRRSQDYYMEGMLLWVEIDAILRQVSRGEVTLDDFCHKFFNATSRLPRPYDRAEVVDTLNSLADYPWDDLIERRVYSTTNDLSDGYVEQMGFQLKIAPKPTPIPGNTFRFISGVDLLDSIGATFSSTGRVSEILLGSPADAARLAPGMTVVTVGNRKWSRRAMLDAIAETKDTPLVLTIADGDRLVPYQLDYSGGSRYLVLEKPDDGQTVISEVVKTKD